MINEHRKSIFDKFYQWVENNIESLPTEVTAEIWNLEECEFWRLYANKVKNSKRSCWENSKIIIQ